MAKFVSKFPDVSPFEDTRGKVRYHKKFSMGGHKSECKCLKDVFPNEDTRVKVKARTVTK